MSVDWEIALLELPTVFGVRELASGLVVLILPRGKVWKILIHG